MQANNTTPEGDKKNIQRSASYPYYTIEESIDFVSKMKVPFQSTRFSREDASKIVHKVDVSRDVASAVQYGLLEKLIGEGYKVTQAAQYIINPISDDEKKDNIIECFRKPKLYNDLIEKYKDQILPNDAQFHVILNRFHSITESAVPQAARVFIQNATFAGLLNKQRILSDGKSRPSDEPSKAASPEEERQTINSVLLSQDTGNANRMATPTENSAHHKQPLLLEEMNGKVETTIRLTEKKVARLVYPDTINQKDIQILKMQIDLLALTLET